MPIFPSLARRAALRVLAKGRETPSSSTSSASAPALAPAPANGVRRHFFNLANSQTYASFFPLWGGWAGAGHCLTDTAGALPGFMTDANGPTGLAVSWPDGLDACLIGTTRPHARPDAPVAGRRVVVRGFPAGSLHVAERRGTVYHERQPGQWIVQLDDGEEPVVVGMSGGPVTDAGTGEPLGILITRNSPADLDGDRDADESCDFTALSAVWDALGARAAV